MSGFVTKKSSRKDKSPAKSGGVPNSPYLKYGDRAPTETAGVKAVAPESQIFIVAKPSVAVVN